MVSTIHSLARYSFFPIIKLICLIVWKSDRQALDEFHRRLLFEISRGRRVCFAEYVRMDRELLLKHSSWKKKGTAFIERAFDLLLDRFLSLPPANAGGEEETAVASEDVLETAVAPHDATVESFNDNVSDVDGEGNKESGENGKKARGKVVDCRCQFRALFKELNSELTLESLDELQQERAVEPILRRFIKRHFCHCLNESHRNRNPLVSRFTWKVQGGSFSLWFPRSFNGRDRGRWLSEHALPVNPANPGEQRRIQEVINRSFGQPTLLSADTHHHSEIFDPGPRRVEEMEPCPNAGCLPVETFVACEKAANIDKQRPAIQKLGAARLMMLVQAVLLNLRSPRPMEDKMMAFAFDLSGPTYSRFAGRDWSKEQDDDKAIPDLYLNVAHVLAGNPAFQEIARQSGVWKCANAIAAAHAKKRLSGDGSHE